MANLKYIGKNILNHDLEVKNGNIIGDHTEVIRVTVQSTGQGNKYVFLGALAPDLTLSEGKTYRFDQSDITNDNHPFRFSIVNNGTWGGGSAYTTNVTTHGTPGVKGAYTEIKVTKVTPNHLYYYCTQHANMGIYDDKPGKFLKNDLNNLHRVSGSSDSTGSFGELEVGGNLTVGQYIYHKDDANTYLNFTDDRLRFNIGGISYIDLNDSTSAPHDITFNDGGNNVDLTIKGSSNNPLFKTDASTNRIGTHGNGSPKVAFHIGGSELRVDGNISGSSTGTGSFGELEVDTNATIDGDLFVTEYIKHKGDVNTAIRFTDNKISLDAGGMTFFAVHDDDSAPFTATVNGGSNKINFRAMDENNDILLKTDSEAFNVGLYYAGSEKLSTQVGGVNITGHITASGNISSSVTSTGSFGKVIVSEMSNSDLKSVSSSISTRLTTEEGNVDTLQARDLIAGAGLTGGGTLASDRTFNVGAGTGVTVNANDVAIGQAVATSDNVTFGSVTTTGNISGSSTSTGSFGRVESNTFNATTFTSTEVTSTNLTVTGTITGSSLDVSGNGNFGGNVVVEGDITAQNYIVSSSVTNITTQELSGSTKFGDSSDDTHQFTGSITLTGSTNGIRVDDGHVRAGRDMMLGSIDESYTNRNTNLQLYYGSGGQAGYIYFLKNGGTGTQYELAANETVFNIKSHRDSQGIGFWTSISGNSPVERLRITGNKISGSSTSTGSFGHVFTNGTIHGKRGSSGATVHPSADEAIFENSANAGISILSGNSNEAAVYFGDSDDNDVGRVRYDHSDNTMDLITGAAIRATVSSDGIEVATGNVSGSSTSTGSFGSVETKRMVMSAPPAAAPKITFNSIGEGSADIYFYTGGTGLILDSGAPIQLDYTTSLRILKAGTEYWRFTANGGLAFGDTSSSTSVLTIKSDSNSPISFEKSSNRQNYLEFKKTSGNLTQPWLIGVDTDSTGTEFRVKNGSTTALTITSGSGNIGIGTTSPAELLNLASSEPVMRFTDTDDNNYHHIFASSDDFFISADRNGTGAGNLIFRNNGTNERMRLDSSGRLGIGEASPDSPLHITYADNTTSTTATGAGEQTYGLKIENTSTTNEAFSQLHLRAGNADAYIRSIYEGTANIGRLGFFVDNTNDVKEAFSISNDGKQISGSSSSTGSFGQVTLAGAYGIKIQNQKIGTNSANQVGTSYLELNSGASGNSSMNLNFVTSNQTYRFINYAGSDIGGENYAFYLRNNNTSKNPFIVVPSAADNLLTLANSKISGSSTSTGSFGTLRVGTKVGSLTSGLVFGDGNTGLHEVDDNTLAITTAGSERIRIGNTGDIGIGIATNSNFKVYIYDNTDSANAWATQIYQQGAGGNGLRVDVNSTDASDFVFQAGANDGNAKVLNVMADGKVGIGQSAPATQLDVDGTSRFQVDTSGTYSVLKLLDNGDAARGHITVGSQTIALYPQSSKTKGIVITRASSNTNSNRVGVGFDSSTTDLPSKLTISGSVEESLFKVYNHQNTSVFEITGSNISGSSTSTGSFGAGFFDDSVGMGVAPGNSNYLLNIEAAQTYAARFKSRKTSSSSAQRTMILVGSGQDKGAGIFFQGPGTNLSIGVKEDNKFHIAPGRNDIGDSSAYSVTVDTSGNLEVTAGNISGSSTSTGSFGRIHASTISSSKYIGQIGSRYVHSQTSDSATWTINHNIGQKYPVVTVYDTSDQMILPQNGVATDSDTFTLTFNEAIQGKAVVSVGGIGTNAGGNYIHTQSDSSTNWNVTHSLSQQYPNITVFDENNEVILPETITALDDNHSTIVFSSGKTGYANFSIGSGIPNISYSNAGKVLKVRSDGTGVEWSPTSNDVSGSMSVSGSITPTIDNFHDLGSATHRWANLHTGDIQLSNEGSEGNEVDGTTGSWTIQEGEDDLYLLNRKNGKKYKFKLEEIT